MAEQVIRHDLKRFFQAETQVKLDDLPSWTVVVTANNVEELLNYVEQVNDWTAKNRDRWKRK